MRKKFIEQNSQEPQARFILTVAARDGFSKNGKGRDFTQEQHVICLVWVLVELKYSTTKKLDSYLSNDRRNIKPLKLH